MDIIYLGHSSFKIAGKAGTVVTDPFDPSMVGIKYPKVEADIVTVSHDHKDHNQTELVTNVHKVISEPGEYEVRGISVLGFPAFHDSEKGAVRGKNTIYVIEIDGFRIAHLGDLGHPLSESAINGLGTIDILMVPVGGEFTIGPADAATVAKAIEPSVIIPMHFKNEGMNPEISDKLLPVEDFLSALGMSAERTNKFSAKEGTLSEEMKVVILERK